LSRPKQIVLMPYEQRLLISLTILALIDLDIIATALMDLWFI